MNYAPGTGSIARPAVQHATTVLQMPPLHISQWYLVVYSNWDKFGRVMHHDLFKADLTRLLGNRSNGQLLEWQLQIKTKANNPWTICLLRDDSMRLFALPVAACAYQAWSRDWRTLEYHGPLCRQVSILHHDCCHPYGMKSLVQHTRKTNIYDEYIDIRDITLGKTHITIRFGDRLKTIRHGFQ